MTDAARARRRRQKADIAFHALGIHKGNPKEAAEALGISETTLRRRVADYCELNGYKSPFEAAYSATPVEKLDEIVQVGGS